MPKLVASGLGPSEFEALKLRPPIAAVSSPRTNSQTLPSQHPSRGLSWVSLVWVSWLNPIIHKASTMGSGQLVAEDIWPAPTDMSADKGAADIRDAWETELRRAFSASKPPSLIYALFQAFKPRLFRAGAFQFAFMVLQFSQPFIIGMLIDGLTGTSKIELNQGLALACALGLVSFSSSCCIAAAMFNSRQLGLQVRTAMMMAVFEKSLRLTNAARMKSSVGNVTNLMAIDAEKLLLAVQFLNFLWHGPCAFFLSLVALYFEVGPSAIAGFALLAMLIPLQKTLSKSIGSSRRQISKASDRRVQRMSEILQGIRCLKLLSWEFNMVQKVQEDREEELKHIWKYLKFNGFLREIMFMAGPLTAVVIFTLYVFGANQDLSYQKMFRCMAFINIVRFPMNLLAQAMKLLYDSNVSTVRLEKFLFLDTLPETPKIAGDKILGVGSVELRNCSFVWDGGSAASDDSAFALQDVSLTIGPTELVAVVGAVGSGKSALISSILGELSQVKGEPAMVGGSKAYMAQTPWIQGLTLKSNVLFGRTFTDANADGSFNAALNAACLLPDLEVLPASAETEIGERGFNLSGGQKARVAFARCLCHRAAAQVFLLDDPFSAVDSATGAAMFKRGVQGVLAGTLRIVTLNSHLNLLPSFDRIVVMQDGRIAFDGPYSLLASSFSQYVSDSTEEVSDSTEVISDQVAPTESKLVTATSEPSNGKLARAEVKATGGVKSSVYFSYIGAGQSGKAGAFGLFGLIFLFFLAQSARVFADIAAARWAKQEGTVHTWNAPVAVYLVGILVTIILLVMRTSLLNIFAIRSSRELHNIVLNRVMKASVPHFFDTRTVGEVLNRFGKDTEVLDVQIPEFLLQVLMNCFMVLSIFALCVASTPFFVVPLFLLAFAFQYIFSVFRATSRDLKRLESVSRSPVYSSFSEALNGLDTIRAFGCTGRFLKEHRQKMDKNVTFFFHLWMSLSWVTIRLEIMGSTVLLLVAVFAVLLSQYGQVNPLLLGVALVYALQLTALFQRCVQVLIDTETYMTSVERLLEFVAAPTEAEDPPSTVESTAAMESWPCAGALAFDNVRLRYRSGPLVLNDLSFSVAGGSSVGVCGRTGAGKSSLITALFRIVELERGVITIDGVDIAGLGLAKLRSSLAIIPQDPVIFSGTLRTNLDPAGAYPDAELHRVLLLVRLKPLVARLANGIEEPLDDMGSSLSQGERQLVCFARALLRSARVLVLDEATSGVDIETDALIQKVLRDESSAAKKGRPTIVTIAHRLQTIIDYDSILVLGSGQVLEHGSPQALLQKTDGHFTTMWADASTEAQSEA